MANKTATVEDPPVEVLSSVNLTWQSWESVAIILYNIPAGTNTFHLWKSFQSHGNIISIDIFENQSSRYGDGRIRFKPPPRSDIWSQGAYKLKLPNGLEAELRLGLDLFNYNSFVDSPVRTGVRYPSSLEIPVSLFDICVLDTENTFHSMRKFENSVKLSLDVRRRQLNIEFIAPIYDRRYLPQSTRLQDYLSLFRTRIEFIQLTKIWETRDPKSGDVTLFFILETPALYFRRLQNVRSTFQSDKKWREIDAWLRQTALMHNPHTKDKQTTNLYRKDQIVDIGRWNAFRMVFPESVASGALKLFHEILSDHNVHVQSEIPFVESKQQPKSVWQWINLSSAQNTESQASLFDDLGNQDYIHLEFPVRYQLEVCISNGWLSEFTMTREFVLKLRDLGEACARRLLEHVATERTTYLDPMEIFNIKMYKGVSDAKIPPYCCFMRTARITPTTVHYNTPTVDTSNRIIRRYIEHADQFLRVRFMDEKTIGRINSTIGDSQDEIYTRVKATLANGITIGDRHYEFLAFGNSQFREHGAYFFAPLPHLNAAMIRAWMGQLSHIRNVAKYAARLGQNFSTTRAFGGCKADVRLIEDISRNGCIFSDGVGKISKFLVSMISGELGLETPGGQLPSAFQFRLGGCKGMLVVSSDPGPHEILIRKSQFKFESPHGGLEIIRCSKLSVATLNRQLILVLSSRGIRDEVFKEKLNNLIANFDEAMQNDAKAISMLRKFVDINQMSLCLARMIESGFRRSGEPFVKSVLALWKAWHLKLLKEKAKILIEQGANVLGCVDETGILKGYFHNSTFRDEASLPQIFLQISQPEKEGTSKIVTGVCIVARNPSLHPGDVRVVKAVDVPELRHLRDVIVFPQTGDQDIPGMCSGGDLDGDDYFIFWDPDLIPENSSWSVKPMKFTSKKAPDLDHEVTVDEVTSFYVTYMKNDILPKVATAHMAWADVTPEGIRSEKCLRLAQLHSDAVDYNKTGGAAMMTRDLEPSQWPHFMEKRFVSAGKFYNSKKILGQLYDSVEKIHFVPHLGMPFNSPVLNCKPELMILSEDFLRFARTLKSDYDSSIRRVMAQHGIKTEFEVWSSWILNHNNLSRDYNIQEDLGRISTLIRQGFRQQCYEKAGGRSFEALAPLVLAMYRVTHEDLVAAQEAAQESAGSEDGFNHDQLSDDPEPNMAKLPLISFPWLFDDYLGRISHGHLDLHAIQSFVATKAETPGSKFYTQEEIQQITADLPIDGWSRKPKFERSTLLPRRESASTYDTELVNDLNFDSGIDMPDRNSETSSNHGPNDDDKAEKFERTITLVDLQTPLNEDHVVEEILEDKDVVIPSALDRLIDIVGD